jgi:hypothetical protein
MHAAYPFDRELIAVAKHYPNVWIDLCWAWSIDPVSTADAFRRSIHTIPMSKLFAFGGDCRWATQVVGFAAQARRGLVRALEAEVKEGYVSQTEAIEIARCVMHKNQYECFDVAGRRGALRETERRDQPIS